MIQSIPYSRIEYKLPKDFNTLQYYNKKKKFINTKVDYFFSSNKNEF